MNGYFTDNQTKQKAYDRYYNAMAKSDFVQGRKLKALIQQESMDDASTDSLANLFQQVMAKTRDYDYDQITQKLTKSAPAVLKGESSTPKTKKGVKVNITPKKKSPKKVKYVPTVTDTDVTMATPPSRKSSSEKNFERDLSENDVVMKTTSPVAVSIKDEPMRSPTPLKTEAMYPSVKKAMLTPPRIKTPSPARAVMADPDLEEKAEYVIPPSPILSPQEVKTNRAILNTGVDAVRSLFDTAGFADAKASPKYFDSLLTGKPTKIDLTLSQAMAKISSNDDLTDLKVLVKELVDDYDQVMERPAKSRKRARDIKVEINVFFNKKEKKKVRFEYLDTEEKAAASTAIEEIVESAKKEVKRKREATPLENSPTDKRSTKKSIHTTPTKELQKMAKQLQAKAPDVQRKLLSDFNDSEESDGSFDADDFLSEINEELRQREYNRMRREEADLVINQASTAIKLHKNLKAQFGKEISKILAEREGKKPSNFEPYAYFKKEFPDPEKGRDLTKYKNEIRGLLHAIYVHT